MTPAAAQLPESHGAADVRVRRLDVLQLFDTQLQKLPTSEVLQLLNSTLGNTPHTAAATAASNGQQLYPQQPDPQQQQAKQQQEQQQQQGHLSEFQWCAADLEQLARASLFLAADVVYDPPLTDAFMHTAAALMRWVQQQQQQQQQQPGAHSTAAGPCTAAAAAAPAPAAAAAAADAAEVPISSAASVPRLIVALEKRVVFTLRDCDAAAPAFEHFMGYLQPTPASLAALTPQELQRIKQQQQQLFKGERIDVTQLPQVRGVVGGGGRDGGVLAWGVSQPSTAAALVSFQVTCACICCMCLHSLCSRWHSVYVCTSCIRLHGLHVCTVCMHLPSQHVCAVCIRLPSQHVRQGILCLVTLVLVPLLSVLQALQYDRNEGYLELWQLTLLP
jgi:hypothetical protein